MTTIKVNSLADLEEAAQQIISSIEGRSIVLFRGGMGAGKTTLISEICAVLGVEDTVTSPTFAIVNEYLTAEQRPVYHFDLYRIDSPREALDLGYEEYFYSGELCLVEWPEKIEELIPPGAMTVSIEVTGEDSRKITIS